MKRYDVGSKDGLGFFCNGYGREDEHGEWVRAEDAAELEKQLTEARAALGSAYADCADECFLVAEGIPPHCGTCWTAAAQKCGDAILALKAAREAK